MRVGVKRWIYIDFNCNFFVIVAFIHESKFDLRRCRHNEHDPHSFRLIIKSPMTQKSLLTLHQPAVCLHDAAVWTSFLFPPHEHDHTVNSPGWVRKSPNLPVCASGSCLSLRLCLSLSSLLFKSIKHFLLWFQIRWYQPVSQLLSGWTTEDN